MAHATPLWYNREINRSWGEAADQSRTYFGSSSSRPESPLAATTSPKSIHTLRNQHVSALCDCCVSAGHCHQRWGKFSKFANSCLAFCSGSQSGLLSGWIEHNRIESAYIHPKTEKFQDAFRCRMQSLGWVFGFSERAETKIRKIFFLQNIQNLWENIGEGILVIKWTGGW